jgi:hypothetical protein
MLGDLALGVNHPGFSGEATQPAKVLGDSVARRATTDADEGYEERELRRRVKRCCGGAKGGT